MICVSDSDGREAWCREDSEIGSECCQAWGLKRRSRRELAEPQAPAEGKNRERTTASLTRSTPDRTQPRLNLSSRFRIRRSLNRCRPQLLAWPTYPTRLTQPPARPSPFHPFIHSQTRPIMAMPTPPPLAISGTGLLPNTLPEPVKQLITLKVKADSLLASPALEAELRDGHAGHQSAAVGTALERILEAGHDWPPKLQGSSKLESDEVARGHYILGWALGRVGEYNGTKPEQLPPVLERALQEYATGALLLGLSQPPGLGSTPSVTRPKPGQALDQALTAEQPGWVGEMLAEYARTQTTLAFSNLLLDDTPIDELVLADLLDLAARRNVQGKHRVWRTRSR